MSDYRIIEPPSGNENITAYDYQSILTLIATHLGNIDADTTPMATNLASIAASLTTIAANSTIIAANSTRMADDMDILTGLGNGTGIHIRGPYDWIGYAAMYRAFVEQGQLLDTSENVSSSDQDKAYQKLESYFSKLHSLPTNF